MTYEQYLYPKILPYHQARIRVSAIHELYYEECGNPQGKPVVFLHGGPGGGCSEDHRRFFDFSVYRIVLFDQRGAGRSTPRACLEENTTWDLVADIERLREHLRIEKWQVFGGSWGSTLALAYASVHPGRVSELVLRGIFLLRAAELKWFYQEGASWIFPEAYEEYVRGIPLEERGDLIAAFYKRLTSADRAEQVAAARAWTGWEAKTSHLLPDPDSITSMLQEDYALTFARIECHYFTHKAFFDSDDELLKRVEKFRSIPGVIIQGRYDVVCPVKSAWDLHRAWPEAEYLVIPDAGHSVFEPGIAKACVEATDRLGSL